MKALINEVYQCPMLPELKNHLLDDLGLSETDRRILESLMAHDADSNFHYDNTGIGRGKFERHLNIINRTVLPELVRMANDAERAKCSQNVGKI